MNWLIRHKKIGFSLATLVVVFGLFAPLKINLHNQIFYFEKTQALAKATDISDSFHKLSSESLGGGVTKITTDGLSIPYTWTDQHTIVADIQITLQNSGEDADGNKIKDDNLNGEVDNYTDIGGWKAIYGKKKDGTNATTIEDIEDYVSSVSTGFIPSPNGGIPSISDNGDRSGVIVQLLQNKVMPGLGNQHVVMDGYQIGLAHDIRKLPDLTKPLNPKLDGTLVPNTDPNPPQILSQSHGKIRITFGGLNPDTDYYIQILADENEGGNDFAVNNDNNKPIHTLADGQTGGNVVPPDGSTVISENNTGLQNKGDTSPQCGISSVFGGQGTITGCLVLLVKFVMVDIPQWFAILAARFLDFFMDYSLQSESYQTAAGQFVEKGWGLARDLTNILFIFVLLYVAIGTILDLKGVNWKQSIATLIIVGLLINFSLFFTKVVVDASNILARVFYTNIVYDPTHPNDIHHISESVAQQFNPQTIMTIAGVNGYENPGAYAVVSIVTGMVLISLIFMFFSICFIFVGRVAGLMLLMIVAPIAFVTLILPGGATGWKYIGFNDWKSKVLSYSFVAPIFLFFLFMVVMFFSLGNQSVKDGVAGLQASTGEPFSIVWKILAATAPILIPYLLLQKAQELAVSMSGEVGAQASKWGGKLVYGSAGWAGRRTAGRLGYSLKESGLLKRMEARGGIGGQLAAWTRTGGSKMAAGTYDVRTASVFGQTADKIIGQPDKKTSYDKIRDEARKKEEDRAKGLEVGSNEWQKQQIFEWRKKLANLQNKQANGQRLTPRENQEMVDLQGYIGDMSKGIDSENKRRRNEYANTVETGLGGLAYTVGVGSRAAHETADKIRRVDKVNKKNGKITTESSDDGEDKSKQATVGDVEKLIKKYVNKKDDDDNKTPPPPGGGGSGSGNNGNNNPPNNSGNNSGNSNNNNGNNTGGNSNNKGGNTGPTNSLNSNIKDFAGPSVINANNATINVGGGANAGTDATGQRAPSVDRLGGVDFGRFNEGGQAGAFNLGTQGQAGNVQKEINREELAESLREDWTNQAQAGQNPTETVKETINDSVGGRAPSPDAVRAPRVEEQRQATPNQPTSTPQAENKTPPPNTPTSNTTDPVGGQAPRITQNPDGTLN